MPDYDVIVIGGGLGGLSSGALLARQGRRVLVLEQSGQVGGCCSTFEKDGFHFDVGASIVEIIQPIEKVFKMLGAKLAGGNGSNLVRPDHDLPLRKRQTHHLPAFR